MAPGGEVEAVKLASGAHVLICHQQQWLHQKTHSSGIPCSAA